MDQEQMMKMMIEGNYGPLPGADSAAVCRQGADEGIVLLKNDGVLPIAEEKIALFGAGAVDTIVCGTGSGSVFPPYVINVEQGLTEGGYTITSRKWLDKFAAASKKANDEADINVIDRYWSGITVLIDEPEVTDEEIEEAQDASVAIYVIRRNTGEGFDRKNEKGDFLLSDMERANLEKIAAAFDQTIVVFNTTVMDPRFTEEIEGIDGVIYMGLLGMEAGRALCDIISGKVCPSGRLTDTWAKKYEDYPASATFSAMARLTELGGNIAGVEDARREFMKKSRRILAYKGELISHIEYYLDGKLAVVHIPWEEIREYSDEYNPGVLIIEEMKMVTGVEVAVAVKTYPDGKVTGKIRTSAPIADTLAGFWGGGGHLYASGFRTYDDTYETVLRELIHETARLLPEDQPAPAHDSGNRMRIGKL